MDAKTTRNGRGRLRRDLINPRDAYSREGFRLKGSGPWIEAGICPFHDDHKPSFRVNLETGRGRCMSCGWSGDLVAFVMQRHGLNFRQAAEHLGAWEDLSGFSPATVSTATSPRARQGGRP